MNTGLPPTFLACDVVQLTHGRYLKAQLDYQSVLSNNIGVNLRYDIDAAMAINEAKQELERWETVYNWALAHFSNVLGDRNVW